MMIFLRMTLVMVVLLKAVTAAEIVFPADPRAVVDVKRDCGAKGDGVADDTDALQQAVYRCAAKDFTRTAYLPKGIYRITRPLVFKPNEKGGEGAMVGPWFYGQDRDTTVIRLADHADGFTDPAKPQAALRTMSRADGAHMNADFFDRTIVNLTVDTGDNAGAIGVLFYSNNTGLLKDVRIVGNGAIGLELGRHDQNGPHLIQDVEIDGFATGIHAGNVINSQTMSRVTVRGAREVGLMHRGQMLSVEGLTVIGAPLAVDTDGVLSLVDCRFQASAGTAGPAIRLQPKGCLYAARIATTGFAQAIAGGGQAGGDVKGPNVVEYSSQAAITLDESSPKAGLQLKPEREPEVTLPIDPKQWVCANDYGAKAQDEDDDADAIQKAIDHAAEIGASTVYLLGGKNGDPNWYWLKKDVRVHGSVARIFGFGFIRILGGPSAAANYPENLAKFVVDDDPKGAKTVVFEHLQVFAPWPSFGIEVKSPTRTVVARTCGGTYIVRPKAKLFITNCVGHCYQEAGSTVWARQWNTEGPPKLVRVNTRNDGGQLWILGMKTESDGTKVATLHGGRTEILGTLNYNTSGVTDDTPFLLVDDGALSSTAFREVCFVGKWWKVEVLARLAGKESRQPQKDWQTWALLRAGK